MHRKRKIETCLNFSACAWNATFLHVNYCYDWSLAVEHCLTYKKRCVHVKSVGACFCPHLPYVLKIFSLFNGLAMRVPQKMGIKNQKLRQIAEIAQTLAINDAESCMINYLLQRSCLVINKMTHYKSILIINNYAH